MLKDSRAVNVRSLMPFLDVCAFVVARKVTDMSVTFIHMAF